MTVAEQYIRLAVGDEEAESVSSDLISACW